MKALLWRIVYAVFFVIVFWMVIPLFLSVVGFNPPGDAMALLRIVVACLAVAYVLFGPQPPMPF
jgi:hypothetical protein